MPTPSRPAPPVDLLSLPTYFARLYRHGFDLACPRCDTVHIIRSTGRDASSLDLPSQIWTCRHCRYHLRLGLYAYPVDTAPAPPPLAPRNANRRARRAQARTQARTSRRTQTQPIDTVPTLAQSRQLAALFAPRTHDTADPPLPPPHADIGTPSASCTPAPPLEDAAQATAAATAAACTSAVETPPSRPTRLPLQARHTAVALRLTRLALDGGGGLLAPPDRTRTASSPVNVYVPTRCRCTVRTPETCPPGEPLVVLDPRCPMHRQAFDVDFGT